MYKRQLLHNAVQLIRRSEHALEDRVRSRHDEVQAENEHRDDGKEDKRELGVDAECREDVYKRQPSVP